MSLKISQILFGTALATAAGISSAADAVLTSVSGAALVNQGDAYVTAEAKTELSAGDRLMVMEGGNAVVTYADGCTYTLSDSEVLTIGKQSTCAGEQAAVEDTGPNFAEAVGGGGIGGPLVIGGTALGVGVGAFSVDSNGKSPSPN